MEEREILEGNKLIADFMQRRYYAGERMLKYHTSLDWLKPAIDKFLSIDISEFNYNTTAMTEFRRVKASLSNMPISKSIEDFWNELVSAITWYNTTKQ